MTEIDISSLADRVGRRPTEVEIKEEFERVYREERLKLLELAKQEKDKEMIDVRAFLRYRSSKISDEMIEKMFSMDPRLVEAIEMDYYLDSPDWVNDLNTYSEWRWDD